MTDVGSFGPLDYSTYDEAVESVAPPKQIAPGRYTVELDSWNFHEARTGRPGIRFELKIINSSEWNGRRLRHDGWWGTGFLDSPLLARAKRDLWDDVSKEKASEDGMVRIRDGTSEPFSRLVGRQCDVMVAWDKGLDGQPYAKINKWMIDS